MIDSTVLTIRLNARAYHTLRSMQSQHALQNCLKDHNKYMRDILYKGVVTHAIKEDRKRTFFKLPDACVILDSQASYPCFQIIFTWMLSIN